jgi:thioredoxin reductase
MALTTELDNYPGFPAGIDGFALAERMQQQAVRFGSKTEYALAEEMDLHATPKRVTTSEGDFYGKTVVIATGATPKELGLPKEKDLVGRGVAYCASCDGAFYRGKTVAVVGGGNSAVADALLLSRMVAPQLKTSVQTLSATIQNVASILISSYLGGMLADLIGIRPLFLVSGVLVALVTVIFCGFIFKFDNNDAQQAQA